MEERDDTKEITETDDQAAVLRDELHDWEKKAGEYLDGWKRAKADYLNLKRESENRQQEVIQYANAALIAELLPILNHFTLALRHVPADMQESDWIKGLGHIKKQFDDFLKQLGIETIKTVGEKFNPTLHDAVDSEAKDGFESDTIFEEVMPGYTLHGKVLAPAKVKVTK